jgi:exo-beta-1,3-glucanase (GH17 family)
MMGRVSRRRSILVCLFLLVAGSGGAARAQAQPAYRLSGLGFSPYVDGQNPNLGSVVTLAQVQARLDVIAPYTEWVRTFGSTHGLEHVPSQAKARGLKVAAGAWIGPNGPANDAEIASVVGAAQTGFVDIVIVGSEALLRGDVTAAQLVAYMNQVRAAIPHGIPVTTADTFDRLLANPSVIAASSILLPNIYPFWQGVSPPNAVCSLANAYRQVLAAAGGKPIVISETGWPSDGAAVGAAVPSPDNAATYFIQFVSWARANGVPYFYFEAFDETWKAAYEGSRGAHWGLWDKDTLLKPAMKPVFDGVTVPLDCNSPPGGPGSPSVQFTYVPPLGSTADLEGQEQHAIPADHKIATYIKVGTLWWVKPTLALPKTPIQPDGSFTVDVTTGGNDQIASEIAVFLIPDAYDPPLLLGSATLPGELFTQSIAHAQVTRGASSISGQITSSSGSPLAGVAISLSGGDTAATVTAASGKYSFVNVSGTAAHTVAASYPDYVFTPPSQAVPAAAGHQTLNFLGTAGLDLSISASTGQTLLSPLTPITDTIVIANAGPIAAMDVAATITLPGSFSLGSIAASRGTCSPSVGQIICNLGALARSASATITLIVTPGAAGWFDVVSAVSSAQPDTAGTNNSVTQTLGIAAPSVTRQDFNIDGRSDLIWQEDATGRATVWFMGGPQGASRIGAAWLNTAAVPGWRIVGTGDFDLNQRPDLVWQEESTRMVTIWYMGGADGATLIGAAWLSAAAIPGWRVVSVADVNGDLYADLIWQEDGTGRATVWYMGGPRGTTLLGASWLNTTSIPGWRIVGTGDFDLNQRPDLVWQEESTRTVTVWYMGGADGAIRIGAAWLNAATIPGWRVTAALDLNGDQRPDLIWQEDTDRRATVWFMGGVLGSTFLGADWISAESTPGWGLVKR